MYDDVKPCVVLDTRALPHQTDGPGLVMGNMPVSQLGGPHHVSIRRQTGNYLIAEHHQRIARLQANTNLCNKQQFLQGR